MTSIPPTNALISMFEKKRDDTDPVKKDVEVPGSSKPLGTKSVTRPLTPPRTLSSVSKSSLSPSRLASSIAWQRTPSPSVSAMKPAQEGHRPTQNMIIEVKARPPTPPPARMKNKPYTSSQPRALDSSGKPRASTPPKPIVKADTVILSPRPKRSTSQKFLLNDIQAQDAVQPGQTFGPRPQYPTSSNEATVPSLREDDLRRSSISSNDTFVSASSVPTPHPSSPDRSRSRPSTPVTPRQRRPPSTRAISTETTSASRPPVPPRRQPHMSSPNLPLDSLTDAIVAGALASSRITPSKTPPPKPPSRKQTPHMRQTLRHPPSKSDDEEVARSRHRKPLGKLGGNKHIHHEGQRRRWREEITLRERKRYEGVWASNRGLLLVSPDARDSLSVPTSTPNEIERERELEQVVANVVVRDIWARSRLPPDELAEVWDLVDRRGRGYLDRTEFVVGMWLIDQRLRGRKIPRKVSESVWGSARGVRVAVPKGGK
ncbi:Increased rDNA silencing protein 4 [Daldinia childiae]|uniref:Increased rDNA silencing protein 4 n=1 Tax=Daldinia childiae TaxID=326645 RepID=UPI0014472FD4|nr:Increased rDNA silencing protein 4 [Daldinia childiae]KAF3064664.1 Increased rDNA silencing protein 4 [Daldinia childiae]